MTTQYRRHADVRVTDLDGEGVILHLRERKYHTLSESGLRLMQRLEHPASVADLVSCLHREYDVSPAEAETSVREFLDDCLATGLVVSEPDG